METNSRSPVRHFVFVGVLAMLLVISGYGFAGAESDLRLEGLTSEQEAIVYWAMELFDEASLVLPALHLVSTPDPDGCQGFDGLAEPRQGHTRITLCTAEAGPAGELLILHELAHAWDFHNLTDEQRSAFRDLRSTDAWLDRSVRWYERGGEQAAEIIVWGLLDRPIRPVKIPANSCVELESGYRTLTGQAPLHGFTDYC